MSFRHHIRTSVLAGLLGSGTAYGGRYLRHRFGRPQPSEAPAPRAWWQRPGIGIQYEIEYRPGMDWHRDFAEFNRSMADESGDLRFNGPLCKVDEWVRLSQEVGADYHMMESKWHDGICYFDTALTRWKTPEDYAGRFADLSRKAGIPFMFYYSSIFDHNPMFDAIQPNRRATVSFIGALRHPQYEDYLRGQYREIMERYRPDGMWFDWYWPGEGSTSATIDFFHANHPETVLSFNGSGLFLASQKDLHYTSSEAHDFDGRYFKLVKAAGATLPIAQSAWKWANLNRRLFDHPWELITPAGKWWQDPSLRDDPLDLARMAAVVMACGGRLDVGILSQLDGSLYPEQVGQLRTLGRWVAPRRHLFASSAALRYRGFLPPGVCITGRKAKVVASRLGDDTLLHLIGSSGDPAALTVELDRRFLPGAKAVFIEPEHRQLAVERSAAGLSVRVESQYIDPVDTILRIQ